MRDALTDMEGRGEHGDGVAFVREVERGADAAPTAVVVDDQNLPAEFHRIVKRRFRAGDVGEIGAGKLFDMRKRSLKAVAGGATASRQDDLVRADRLDLLDAEGCRPLDFDLMLGELAFEPGQEIGDFMPFGLFRGEAKTSAQML